MSAVALALLNKFKGWIAAVAALLSALAWAFLRGRSGAKGAARAEQQAERAQRNATAADELTQAAKEKADVDADMARISDADAADRLRNGWSRD